ncbi:MAG TPA: hypothetical protein DCZ62_05860 [Ruminococcus sp.]|nr:hypothetical protein [Ruminococcus sp.]
MEEEKKKRRFAAWDMKFIMIHVLCSPIIFIRLYMYPGIAVPMWSIGVGIFILAAVTRYVLAAMGLEKQSLEKKWPKALYWSACILGILLMLTAFFLPAKIGRHFEKDQSMYTAKRYVYIEGVKDGKDAGLLPEELPGDITDYYFSTMSEMPMAQDYRPYAYLVFHGSEELLRSFETKFSQMSGYELAETKIPDEAGAVQKPESLPMHVFDKLLDEARINEDLSRAVIYLGNDGDRLNSATGALLNYDTGLVVIWQ